MSELKMIAQPRETGSKGALKALRKADWVPAVVYGKHTDSKVIRMSANEVKRHGSYMVPGSSFDLELGGETLMVIVKEVQRDPVLQNVVHLDLQELTAGEAIRVKIPVHLHNRELVEGGNMVVQQLISELEIVTLPKDLVQSVDVDCRILNAESGLTVAELPIFQSEAIEVLAEGDAIVAALTMGGKEKVESEEEEESAETFGEAAEEE